MCSETMSKKAYILLADDEPNVLLTLKLVLEQDGYEVVTAESAATAIALMNQPRRFDAILTDLNMEKEDIGLEVALEAAKLQPRPAIIIITGFGSIENARAALKIQVAHFATKPIDLNDLMLTLDRFLHGRQPLGLQEGLAT
jgi:DNA-binding NtrC family response regulator